MADIEEPRILLLGKGMSRGFLVKSLVKSAYSILVDQRNGLGNDVFKLLWKAKALPKVLITAWRILLDRIPTSKNLMLRGVDMNSPLCALCNLFEESTQHLFLDCDVNQVWKGVWVAIVRCIWEHRNNVISRQRVPDSEEILQAAQLLSWLWLKHRESIFEGIACWLSTSEIGRAGMVLGLIALEVVGWRFRDGGRVVRASLLFGEV
ncbi:uncharacterized protein [Phaseolus vulgaris]|uniref:uncharacterized protein n=1 Tax=Phaseolus vulgaris TaxID=3885 RepID=UPI0035CA0CEF